MTRIFSGSRSSIVAGFLLLAVIFLPVDGRAEPNEPPGKASSSNDADDVRVINFSGVKWWVKESHDGVKMGPGPNHWSASQRNVWVDDQGRLHLKITRDRDAKGKTRWYCAEVVSDKSFGYGTYSWTVETPIFADPKIVLGLFTWDDNHESAQFHHREIDVELLSTWGETNSERNAQFCVQPYTRSQNRHRFSISNSVPATTHTFQWTEKAVAFKSFSGHEDNASSTNRFLNGWTFSKSGVPPAGGENVRMNLWLLAPIDDTALEPEVIISRFHFEQLQP